MSAFTNTFSTSTPAGSAIANTLDTVIQGDKGAINERIQLEHYAFDASGTGQSDSSSVNAQGRHKPGYVRAVLVDTATNIALITPLGGELAYDTTNNRLLVAANGTWTGAGSYNVGTGTAAGNYAFSAYMSANQTPTASTWVKVTFNTEIFDSGSKYDHATNYRYTPGVAGIYQINLNGMMYVPTGKSGTIIAMAVYKTGVIAQDWNHFVGDNIPHNQSVGGTCLLSLGATDYVEAYCYFGISSGYCLNGVSSAFSTFSGHLVGTV